MPRLLLGGSFGTLVDVAGRPREAALMLQLSPLLSQEESAKELPPVLDREYFQVRSLEVGGFHTAPNRLLRALYSL